MSKLDHSYIVKIFEYFETDNSIFIVMEYLEGKELFEFLVKKSVRITEKLVCKVAKQVLSALNYLHTQGIIHGDIKSENILFNGKNISLIDFGTAKEIDNIKVKETQGTPSYIAPEVYNSVIINKNDIWSLGVLIYILVAGSPPFKGK